MKFVRSLEFARAMSADKHSKEQFLSFTALKKVVCQIAASVAAEAIKGASPDLADLEDSFTRLFTAELAKTSTYYESEKKAALAAWEADSAATTSLEGHFIRLCILKQFLELNYAGFLKVLRSHDKYSKTLIQAQCHSQVEIALPQGDALMLQEKIDAVIEKYSQTFCSGNSEMAKNKLGAIWQEKHARARAMALAELAKEESVAVTFPVTRGTEASATSSSEAAVTISNDKKKDGTTSVASPCPVVHRHNPYRIWQILILSAIFALILIFPVLKEKTMNKVMAICVLSIGLWITEAIPLYATALLVPILLVITGVYIDPKTGSSLGAKEAANLVASKMFSPISMMFLGGFSIAAATTKYGIARQLAIFLLKFAGDSPGRLVAYLMFLSQFISFFVSNVAAPVLCYTLLSPLFRALPPGNALGKKMVLGVSVAANLGGAISPISSPQNVITLESVMPVSWPMWLAVAIPFCGLASLGSWLVIMGRQNKNGNEKFNGASYFQGGSFKWGWREVTIILTILATIAMWAFPAIGVKLFGANGVIALLPLIVFFGLGMLGKEDFNSFSWNVVILAIGGSLMGDAVRASGLLDMIANTLKMFSNTSTYVQVVIVGLVVTIATCFISHTVGAIIFLPVVKAISHENRWVMMAATLATSAGMALPISSFPNMAAAAQEDSLGRPWLTSGEFVRYGIVCSLITWLSICSIAYGIMAMLNF